MPQIISGMWNGYQWPRCVASIAQLHLGSPDVKPFERYIYTISGLRDDHIIFGHLFIPVSSVFQYKETIRMNSEFESL